MAHAHCIWVTEATNTHSEYGRITAFPLQQRLHECTSTLRYTYTACLVLTNLFDIIFPQCQRQKGALGHFSLLVIGLSMSGSFHHRPIHTFHSSTNNAIILALDSVIEQNTTLSRPYSHISYTKPFLLRVSALNSIMCGDKHSCEVLSAGLCNAERNVTHKTVGLGEPATARVLPPGGLYRADRGWIMQHRNGYPSRGIVSCAHCSDLH